MQLDCFKTNHYHNTIPERGAVLETYEAKACKQDEIVKRLFEQHPTATFTPYEVWLRLGQQWPLTSVRRAITNLTNDGVLVMTDQTRAGGYGRNNNVWKLK